MDKVLGIGNALVDIMTKLPDDSTLERFNLKKGSMQLTDRDLADKINNETYMDLQRWVQQPVILERLGMTNLENFLAMI